ncbi:MAG: phosphodiester glycosidase family protein [Clostridia bacterium]|nr:phosphodiester glycosidase family protein [Clostridia bacterium]
MAKKKKKSNVNLPQLNLPKVDFAGALDGVKARFSGNRPEKPLTKAERRHKARVRRITWRVTLSVLTVIGVILLAALAAGWAAFRGPSPSTGDLLTMSMLETSALKFVPRLYYSASEMDAIIARNAVDTGDSETDTSLIVIAKPTPTPDPDAALEAAATPVATAPPENLLLSEDGIDVFQVQGGTYKGYMMVVYDPSRVTCGTCRDTFTRQKGLQLKDIAKRYDAVAAINGGGFEDAGGAGNGGTPIGLVVSNGKLMHTGGDSGDFYATVGFNQDDVMIISKMSASEAKKKGIRDAITFGPRLIVNGEPANVKGQSSGLNPRTAIGQRADGAVLMLVIDGRQASSLGATYSDLIKVMVEYGAVNAINLDGGSSSLMYYRGNYLNNGVVLTGSREMPTAFIVR